jgi:hypothetical protein
MVLVMVNSILQKELRLIYLDIYMLLIPEMTESKSLIPKDNLLENLVKVEW